MFSTAWASGLLLFCTDGLSDMLRDEEIEKIAAENYEDPKTMVDRLAEAALEKGGTTT